MWDPTLRGVVKLTFELRYSDLRSSQVSDTSRIRKFLRFRERCFRFGNFTGGQIIAASDWSQGATLRKRCLDLLAPVKCDRSSSSVSTIFPYSQWRQIHRIILLVYLESRSGGHWYFKSAINAVDWMETSFSNPVARGSFGKPIRNWVHSHLWKAWLVS